MKIGLCDDSRVFLEKVQNYIEYNGSLKGELSYVLFSPSELYYDVVENCFECEILVTNCFFNDQAFNGIGLAKLINDKYPACKIIFLSEYVDWADYLYEVEHVFFVQKKNIKKLLFKALNKALLCYNESIGDKVVEIFSEGRKSYIVIKDIIYVVKNERNIKIITEKESLPCILSLRKFQNKIGNETIVRANGSTLVNIRHVERYSTDSLLLDNGETIEVGERFKDEVQHAYINWWKDRL